ncbi:unnamed protein product [Moneuplotes crassus]|uniref:Uncharacterized protein n=1 Tax=Euplotes crassus TaxID=5936 RepID=A0AAD1UFT2_EUPCR|nr:unnamed protein product [Moneuplotes crassus]
MKIFVIAFLILGSFGAEQNVFLAQLTSEGARSPNGENLFECGFENGRKEITSMGLRQHYLIGSDLVNTYTQKLDVEKLYSPLQVNVRSTNHNMTLMGAQAQLEALFPPNIRGPLNDSQVALAVPPGDNTIIEEEIIALGNNIMALNFQTVPIHAMDFQKETVLMGEWCPEIYEMNERKVKDAQWMRQIEEKYSNALAKFRTFMGNDNLTIHEIYPNIDTIYACDFNQDKVKGLESVTKELLAFGFEYLEQYWSYELSRKIFVHGFLSDLGRYFQDGRKQFEDTSIDLFEQIKLALYFGTVETTYVISRHLGFQHTQLPQFASQLLIHLAKDTERGYVVSVEYNKNLLKLRGECEEKTSCLYDNFNSFISKISADEDQLSVCTVTKNTMLISERNSDEYSNSLSLELIVTITVLGFISIIISAIIGHKAAQYQIIKRRRTTRRSDSESFME